MTVQKGLLLAGMAFALIGSTGVAFAQTELVIESWRNDDLAIWNDKIIPAFEAAHPDINVTFAPMAPTEYNAAVNAKIDAGTAGDLITCRPFDVSLAMYDLGYLTNLNDLPGMENFSDVAKSAWSTDDGAETFCVPMAAVLHGFIYNKDIFAELGLTPPATEAEFFELLEKIKADGQYVPLAMGTKDTWEAATMGYYNIGPNYWKGEEGRKAVIAGEQKLNEGGWLDAMVTLAKWKDYLGDGFEAQTYPDSQNLFTLGRAAIYPAGSWEISGFRANADFEMGVFAPPVKNAGDTCYFSDFNDIGMGLNARAKNPDAAKTFLTWVASPEFAAIYSNELPGFFSMSNIPVASNDPLAQQFVDLRQVCESTIRPFAQILSRGDPNADLDAWVETANAINGTETPEEAANTLQTHLEAWYKPGAM